MLGFKLNHASKGGPGAGLGSIPKLELELTSIPIPIPELELELQAMELELELELQNGIDWNWNGIEDSISIPPSILLTFSILSYANGTYWCFKNSNVFFKERICFKISYCKKISVIELWVNNGKLKSKALGDIFVFGSWK